MILSSVRIRYVRGYNVREMVEDRRSCRRRRVFLNPL